jgi:hypothetical protein
LVLEIALSFFCGIGNTPASAASAAAAAAAVAAATGAGESFLRLGSCSTIEHGKLCVEFAQRYEEAGVLAGD